MLFNIQELSVEASSGYYLTKLPRRHQERFVVSRSSKHAFPTKIKLKWEERNAIWGLANTLISSLIHTSKHLET